eukprot:100596-Chlamydomonas_euryale.AAC.2
MRLVATACPPHIHSFLSLNLLPCFNTSTTQRFPCVRWASLLDARRTLTQPPSPDTSLGPDTTPQHPHFPPCRTCRHLKLVISKIDPAKPEAEAKSSIIREISDFINGRIYVADHMICQSAAGKVDSGDVIMTFAYSHVVAESLLKVRGLEPRVGEA